MLVPSGRQCGIDTGPRFLADQRGEGWASLARAEGTTAACGHLVAQSSSQWHARSVAHHRWLSRRETEAERPGIIAIVEALHAVVPDDAMIYSDMTQFAYVANEVWPMTRAKHWHHPSGFGTLGYALPAAIGGAVARPGKPTMAIAGDYGFQYSVQELGTAVELGQPLPIILWDNGKLKEIEDSMRSAQIAPNAVLAKNPNFLDLARAYGADASAPNSLAQMQEAVVSAFDAERPKLIYLSPNTVS